MTNFGAHVVSYVKDEKEVLFMSELALKDGATPIRGGIPLVFPQFGKGKLLSTSHGFARRSTWKRVEAASRPSAAIACFELITIKK